VLLLADEVPVVFLENGVTVDDVVAFESAQRHLRAIRLEPPRRERQRSELLRDLFERIARLPVSDGPLALEREDFLASAFGDLAAAVGRERLDRDDIADFERRSLRDGAIRNVRAGVLFPVAESVTGQVDDGL